MKASEIAALVGGILEGTADPELLDLAPIDRAGPEHLTFLADARYASYLEQAQAGAILISESLTARGGTQLPRIVVQDVHRALGVLLARFHPEPEAPPGIHPTAVLGTGVDLGPDVRIGPYAVIGAGTVIGARAQVGANVVVGENCRLGEAVVVHAQATLYRGVRIGARSIIHSGARIGSDGFGYTPTETGLQKIPQAGGCILGEDVEIGANTTIDRGSVGATEIGNGVKIDNLVHIGHNVRVGDHTVIVAQVGISGSTRIGRRVQMGGQAGINGHIEICDGAVIAGQAGVFSSITEPGVYSGWPARPHKETLRTQALTARLPGLLQRLRAVERKLSGESSE